MMGSGGSVGSSRSRSLEETPTWVVALICLCLIAISFLIERSISSLGNWLRKKRKQALTEALEKLKSELMLLGFLSLLLTVAQSPISHIRVQSTIADKMLPCRKISSNSTEIRRLSEHLINRRLLWRRNHSYEDGSKEANYSLREQKPPDSMMGLRPSSAEGKVPLISQEAITQLHVFIFMLAVMHVTYTIFTMFLGRVKISRWKSWEKETQTTHYQVENDPQRFRFLRETSFGKRHSSSWAQSTPLLWIKCFFRQFYSSVDRVDYLTLRHGFIMTHLPANVHFNFHEYIKRSLDNDFKSVVGISPALWLLLVVFLLLDVYGLYLYFWISFVPLVMMLAVGAKLQMVVARMALRLKDETSVIVGIPLVQPTNELFWFRRPKLVLFLIHFILFPECLRIDVFHLDNYPIDQIYELEFGLKSCYHENFQIIIARVVIAVIVQFVCSYVTLPQYALVTQMGSHYKESMFRELTVSALRRWHMDVKQKLKQNPSTAPGSPLSALTSSSNTPRTGAPPSPLSVSTHALVRDRQPSDSNRRNANITTGSEAVKRDHAGNHVPSNHES